MKYANLSLTRSWFQCCLRIQTAIVLYTVGVKEASLGEGVCSSMDRGKKTENIWGVKHRCKLTICSLIFYTSFVSYIRKVDSTSRKLSSSALKFRDKLLCDTISIRINHDLWGTDSSLKRTKTLICLIDSGRMDHNRKNIPFKWLQLKSL